MGNITELSNDLLVKILLFIPSKDGVATSLLCKRWRPVWKLVPKLEYNGSSSATATRFINKYLQLSNVQFLDTFHLKLKREYAREEFPPEDYETWVNIAVARNVRDLELLHDRSCLSPIPLLMSLYKHQTLVVLRLKQAIIEDVPTTTCFRCLKTLSLLCVSFSGDHIVDRLLSCYPILESLVVCRWGSNDVKTFNICVPSLQSLEIEYEVLGYHDPRDDHGFVINTPLLKKLEIVDHLSGFCSLVHLPEQVEAKTHRRHCDSEKLLGSLTSARSLSLCLKPQMDSYPKVGFGFDQLVSLELCVMCSIDWLNLILKHSPKLQALRFRISRHASCMNSRNVRTKWEQPSCVHECLLLSLEIVEWIRYKGTQEEQDVVKYLLENGNFLKTMNIEFSVSLKAEEKNIMLMELDSNARSSSNCQLSFVP